MQSERVGNVYHIHNNLPYAEKGIMATAPGGSGIADEKRYNRDRTVKNGLRLVVVAAIRPMVPAGLI
jgi:hypothetical protein